MVRSAWMWTPTLAAAGLLWLGAGRSSADIVVVPPTVTYYAPPPVVSYYSPPVVYPAPAPVVSYYTPAVTYYTPAVSYYAPAASVTTTRYGPLGRPRVVRTRYYTPVYVGP